jgi:EF-hand domain pair
MLLALGAASAALDAIKSLTSKPSSSQPIGSGPASGSPFDVSAPPAAGSPGVPGFSGGTQISPATLSALLAAQSQSSTGAAAPAATDPASALQDLFSQIDANGDGKITKSEFEKALGAGGTNIAQADHVFSQLDKNGDGTVSIGELASALQGKSGGHGHHGHAHIGGSGGSHGSGDGGAQGGTGLSSSSLTPVDPSQLTPISMSAASYARLEQLIQNGPQFSTSAAPLSLSV